MGASNLEPLRAIGMYLVIMGTIKVNFPAVRLSPMAVLGHNAVL
jgi:hypothetical protein